MARLWGKVALSVFLLCVAVCWNVYLVAVRPRRRINPQRFKRVQEGMTRQEVIAIIGLSPGDYTVFKHTPETWRGCFGGKLGPAGVKYEEWASDEGLIAVTFEGDKVVARYYFDAFKNPDRGALDMLFRLVFGRR
jgi:hypothetical protein